MSKKLDNAREQLSKAEQDLQEAIENSESAKVISMCREAVRRQKIRVTRMENEEK